MTGVNAESIIWKLFKSIYALKQAIRVCIARIDRFLKQLGSASNSDDPCSYVRSGNEMDIVNMALIVEALRLAGKNMFAICWMKVQLSKLF